MKILIEAYECSPIRAHAAGSAWQIVSRLARRHELWILTEKTQYESEILKYLSTDGQIAGNMHFYFIPKLGEGSSRKLRPVLPIKSVIQYHRWLRKAYTVACSLHCKIGFDVVHHLRGDSFREPGYLWKLNVPFIWGPTGGIAGIPLQLMRLMDVRNCILHLIRNLITKTQFYFSPAVRSAAKKASTVFAQSLYDQRCFIDTYRSECIVAHEQALDPSKGEIRRYSGKSPLKIVWAGRCIGLKGIPILIRAIKLSGLKNRVQVHIAGDGPLLNKWIMESKRLGISDCFNWHGWMSQSETIELMNKCDILAFPSLLEATSAVATQALSLGLPVIAIQHCGLEDIVDDTCGFSINPGSATSVIQGFADALTYLVNNPFEVERLSIGACRKAKAFGWDRLVELIDSAYQMSVRGVPHQSSSNLL